MLIHPEHPVLHTNIPHTNHLDFNHQVHHVMKERYRERKCVLWANLFYSIMIWKENSNSSAVTQSGLKKRQKVQLFLKTFFQIFLSSKFRRNLFKNVLLIVVFFQPNSTLFIWHFFPFLPDYVRVRWKFEPCKTTYHNVCAVWHLQEMIVISKVMSRGISSEAAAATIKSERKK